MTKLPHISIIIPAYNEENRLRNSLEKIERFLQTQNYPYEVIIVENGSTDRTLNIAQEFSTRHPHFRALHLDESGKGRAVRHGMLAASGQFRFMCDADLSMPIEELPRFLPPNFPEADIVIASREAPGAVRYNEPEHRHIGGRLINWVIRLLALPGLPDSQCGFKNFRGEVADDLFACQLMDGWSFDIELLYIARRRGYKIKELPIPWYYSEQSHVSPVRDALRMMWDIFKIQRNARRGAYAQEI
jgi:glycosyltransferase involved in cell wall biosynthesis